MGLRVAVATLGIALSIPANVQSIPLEQRVKISNNPKAQEPQEKDYHVLKFVNETYDRDDSGELVRILGDPNGKAKSNMLTGNAKSIEGQYQQLRRNGSIPDMVYLESKLHEIAQEMSKDPFYLIRSFNYGAIPTNIDDAMTFNAKLDIGLNGKEYSVSLVAFGRTNGGSFIIDELFDYQIKRKDSPEQFQIGNKHLRWWLPLENGTQLRVFLGSEPSSNSIVEVKDIPDLTGIWGLIKKAVSSQHIPYTK